MSQLTEKTENVTPNRLVSLKVLVFLFFGALQCMYAFLPHHMEYLGFTKYDIRLITLASALVSIIGPLIIGFILDRISIKRPSAYGKWLRVLLFIFFILAGIFFGLLLLVTPAGLTEIESVDETVTFSCRDDGGYVYVKKNLTEGQCKNLEGKIGELKLLKCSYTCESPENFKDFSQRSKLQEDPSKKSVDTKSNQVESDENASTDYIEDYSELTGPEPAALTQEPTSPPLIPPPHICLSNTEFGHCHVYLNESVIILPDMKAAKWDANKTNDFNEDWCKHPLESFNCQVPEQQVQWMKLLNFARENFTCTPAVECHISDPFGKESILRFIDRTQKYSGEPIPYEVYVPLRVIAELFPVIIHMLLNIAIIIATRETSIGRGNVGHQWAFYPIGLLVFASVIGLLNHAFADDTNRYLVPILTFSITMFICAIVVLFSGKLPLTPSDWWWHTKCGMLAIPMSALKRYKWVIAAIATVSFILGGLWHIQEVYRHLFTIDLIEYAIIENGVWRNKTFVYIIGSILAIPLIWNGEKIVDCLGHSNIFILAFVSFALRFAGLYFDHETSYTTLYEILEPLSFYLPVLALILFTRHLIPKKLLALGQGLLVILFFALGRAFGFFYGTSIISDDKNNKYIYETPEANHETELNDFQTIYTVGATIACIAAIIYFTIYHCILLPYYHVPTNRLGTSTESNVSPQRVFHDERSRKGYFRY
ncbi:unnamed protein product [Chironomus riparius]|uniref:Major facilitator superfamily associated domain-containing protein n=1 Tax=Chironomus riparius TaxID=315576 RepID=A0A9N9WWT1_9DIPT|nr:unnamed protein product [Chironomus riparius]